jgi:AcrR family transcriptional regulator
LVSQAQRSRIVNSAVQVLSEQGYTEMSVARITGRAGVSRRTFYDLFEDREGCFLAAFDDAAMRAREVMLAATRSDGRRWHEQTREALLALLRLLDAEPGLRSLLIMEALKAGPKVQARRTELLGELGKVLHQSASRARTGQGLPVLTGEGIVGAVVGMIHTRLSAKRPKPLVELLGSLMGMIVLPYLGAAAAHRELTRPAPKLSRQTVSAGLSHRDVLAGIPMRVTRRTLLVLRVIAEQPGATNRQVSTDAGVADQGQMSKLLARLEGLGLIENASTGQPSGDPNSWRLTSRGQELQQVTWTASAPTVSPCDAD